MTRIGIFGGAFNPIHNGHIAVAKEALKELNLQKMLIIPTYKSPHKNTKLENFEHRSEMCRIVFEDDKKFEVCEIEKEIKGASYTINTLRALKKRYPYNTEFFLIIGGDMLFGFESWYRYESILKECKVVAVPRKNDEYINLLEFATELGRVKVLNTNVIEVSSTEIRNKIKNKEDLSELVPTKINDYIKENKLFGGA